MNECICLKGVTFDRKYFHSATLLRPKEDAGEKYAGNLTLIVNFIVPNIGGSQGILKTMFLKEATPIETIDLYRDLLLKLELGKANLPSKSMLIKELLTADEKALSKTATSSQEDLLGGTVPPISEHVRAAKPNPPSVLEATEEDAKTDPPQGVE